MPPGASPAQGLTFEAVEVLVIHYLDPLAVRKLAEALRVEPSELFED